MVRTYDSNFRGRGNVIWEEGWNHDYISPWCIFEWFKKSNFATNRDILETYGIEEAKTKRSKRSSRELWCFKWVNKTLLAESVFGKALFSPVDSFVNRFIKPVNSGYDILQPDNIYNPKYYFIRQQLVFCPECMKIGFHSLFHQFVLLDSCPFHGIKLQQYCPRCHSASMYELSSYTPRAGVFSCRCGHVYVDRSSSMDCWEDIHGLQVINKEISDWILIKNSTLDYVSQLQIFPMARFRDEKMLKGEQTLKEIVGFLKDMEEANKIIHVKSKVIMEEPNLPDGSWFKKVREKLESDIKYDDSIFEPKLEVKGKEVTVEQFINYNIDFDTYVCLTLYQIYKSVIRRIRRKYIGKIPGMRKRFGQVITDNLTLEQFAYLRTRQEYEGECLYDSYIDVIGPDNSLRRNQINLRHIPAAFTIHSFDGVMTFGRSIILAEYRDYTNVSIKVDRRLWAGVVRACSRMFGEQLVARYKAWISFLEHKDLSKEDDRLWLGRSCLPEQTDFPMYYLKVEKDSSGVYLNYHLHKNEFT